MESDSKQYHKLPSTPPLDKQSQWAWERVNEVCRRKSSSWSKLKAANEEERLQKWKEHFVADRKRKLKIKSKMNI